jgi:hypothetical protein
MPVIPDVPAFKLETDSGNMALLAVQAALSAVGVAASLVQLAGASGDAFKFVYDNAPVREPLRDLRPWDSLARAFAIYGLRAEWVPDATLDHVRGQVEAHAAIGQPVLTSNLPYPGYHGFALLVGYDEELDALSFQRALPSPEQSTGYDTLQLDDDVAWNGPIAGPPFWADFPMLVIRGALFNPSDEASQRKEALQTALNALTGDPVAYPAHSGAQRYAQVPLAERKVRQGWVALDYLARDLAESNLGDFDTIWRLNAQLAQLAWDRELVVLYLETWGRDAPAALIARYRTIAHTARTLLSRNWERRSATMYSLDELTQFVEGTAAYLYALPDDPKIQTDMQERGLGRILQTPWGAGLLVESPHRLEGAVKLAQRLLDYEHGCINLLEAALKTL